ncbi:TadE/TadG family type IV pilus assembly protein [Roseobacter weihaiensis]|uniref:TadE/TadG family type IV pilus assembly protein n=1 Tax=Roseobacter weihaiensis TaxID=2763262 RepID=UPI001D0A3B30|nr:hypothetical protein [Roseobacter sp. H9]
MAIEAVILVPVMIWGYLAMFTIFDSYRQYTTQQKAAYTVSDLISRQWAPIDAGLIDGTHTLFEGLTRAVGETGMRVTVVQYNDILEEYQVVWSRTRGGMVGLSSEDVASWSDRLPDLVDQEQLILVETTAAFSPVFSVGLGARTINNFVFTRPRYTGQVCFDDNALGEVCDMPGPVVPPVSDDEQA